MPSIFIKFNGYNLGSLLHTELTPVLGSIDLYKAFNFLKHILPSGLIAANIAANKLRTLM